MTEEPCFGDYWDSVDAVMLKFYGIDTMDIDPLTADMIAQAEEDGWTPEEFALWCADQFGLTLIANAEGGAP